MLGRTCQQAASLLPRCPSTMTRHMPVAGNEWAHYGALGAPAARLGGRLASRKVAGTQEPPHLRARAGRGTGRLPTWLSRQLCSFREGAGSSPHPLLPQHRGAQEETASACQLPGGDNVAVGAGLTSVPAVRASRGTKFCPTSHPTPGRTHTQHGRSYLSPDLGDTSRPPPHAEARTAS